jgi:hypothetical protein
MTASDVNLSTCCGSGLTSGCTSAGCAFFENNVVIDVNGVGKFTPTKNVIMLKYVFTSTPAITLYALTPSSVNDAIKVKT